MADRKTIRNNRNTKRTAMAVEFYMFEDELWYIKDGIENQALSEKNMDVIKKMIDIIV